MHPLIAALQVKNITEERGEDQAGKGTQTPTVGATPGHPQAQIQ